MAVSLAPTRGGRRRSLDAAINLVPFIDLLSCCIAFLLITAVWSQVATLDVQTAGGEPGEAVSVEPPTLWIGVHDFELRVPGQQPIALEPATLAAVLRSHRGPAEDLIVQSTDGVTYQRLVVGLDAARAAGFVRIAVGNGS
jgi:biopolymer transport protein ExbD